jgi:hypothetical protein
MMFYPIDYIGYYQLKPWCNFGAGWQGILPFRYKMCASVLCKLHTPARARQAIGVSVVLLCAHSLRSAIERTVGMVQKHGARGTAARRQTLSPTTLTRVALSLVRPFRSCGSLLDGGRAQAT